LTYSIYLLHFSVIGIQLLPVKTPSYADDFNEASKVANFHLPYFTVAFRSTCDNVQRYSTLHEKLLMLKNPRKDRRRWSTLKLNADRIVHTVII
jgi:hypothetical protein